MTTVDEDMAEELRREFAERLSQDGHVRSPHWRAAFAAVPREEFVAGHGVFTVPDRNGSLTTYDLDDPTQDSLAAIYDVEATLLVQWDRTGTPTSSSTSPRMMAAMLEELDARPGHRVLELGTGTGYTTALLCTALGDEQVTSVEVDPVLVRTAQSALRSADYGPAVVCADGAHGAPARAPFDRIIATCGLTRVPAALLEQLSPGGVLVAPVALGLAVLYAQPGGGVIGRFVSPAGFQARRAHPSDTELSVHQLLAVTSGAGEHQFRADSLAADAVVTPALRFLKELVYPNLRWSLVTSEDPQCFPVLHLFDPSRNSWARAELGETEAEVVACGATGLYGLVRELVQWWGERGRPGVERFGLSVRADGTHELWLDDPAGDSRVLS